ncbi:PUA-like domain-containing protein [Mucidula mucida]|nr:PUA-like domain-containing protein [Mucidula mucida]
MNANTSKPFTTRKIYDGKRHGEIADSPVGTLYKDKSVLRAAGVHCNQQGGIYGDNENGAYSISISGQYPDDIELTDDNGNNFIYSGAGGSAPNRPGQRISDQEWVGGNLQLKISHNRKKPVRVVRGSDFKSPYAPPLAVGKELFGKETRHYFRYDGLYLITEAERVKGKSGFMTCLFTFERIEGQEPLQLKAGNQRDVWVPADHPEYAFRRGLSSKQRELASPIIAPVEYAEDIEEPPRSPSPSCSDAGRMEALQDVPDATGKLSESRYSRRAVGRISKYPAGSVPVKPELADS